MLDGTSFAPAYNASLPASRLGENAAHLEQFFHFAPSIRNVFLEVFIYNFRLDQPDMSPKSWAAFAGDAMALQFSADALLASFHTIAANRSGAPRSATVALNGVWIPPELKRRAFSPDLYIEAIVATHRTIPELSIQPDAVAALDRIVALCRRHGAHLRDEHLRHLRGM